MENKNFSRISIRVVKVVTVETLIVGIAQKYIIKKNRLRYRANAIARKQKYLQKVRIYLVKEFAKGCVDCGNTDIRVLDFDHVRGEKLFPVSHMVRHLFNIEKIKLEISKCEVRCKNCHAIKTYNRMGKTWHQEYLT